MNMIHGVPKEKWLKAFDALVEIAIDQDYFSDILVVVLYPDHNGDYDELWAFVKDARKEIFGD